MSHGEPGNDDREVTVPITSLPNADVGLVIATRAFAGTPAESAALGCRIVEIAGSLLFALMGGRRTTANHPFAGGTGS